MHFKDDNTVAVVYSGWVAEKGKYCFWPTKGNATDMARNFAPLTVHFRRFELTQVLYETGKHCYDVCMHVSHHIPFAAVAFFAHHGTTLLMAALCCVVTYFR